MTAIMGVAVLVALLTLAAKKKDTTGAKNSSGETEESERKFVWEQTTLAGSRAVTFAKAGEVFTPVKLMFAAGGIFEQLGFNVPEHALAGKKVPVGGKLCCVIEQQGERSVPLIAHGSVISSLLELGKSWMEAGAEGLEELGVQSIESPERLKVDEYEIRKGEGQYAQLWIERRN